MSIIKIGDTILNKGAKGDNGIQGADGSNGSNGADGYTPVKNVDYFDGADGADGAGGIALDPQTEIALKFKKGYRTPNYFNYLDLQDGYISSFLSEVITPPTASEKVSGKVYLKAGWYGLYNISASTWTYIQRFNENDVYQDSVQFKDNNQNFGFEMLADGYIIFDVNRRVTTPLDEIVLADWNPLFTSGSNQIQYYTAGAAYEPYFSSEPKIVYEATDNLIDVSKIQEYVGAVSDVSGYIRVTGMSGGEIVSIWDDIKPLYDPTKPLIVEYNSGGTEIATYTTPLTGQYHKQHTLNASTSYFDILIWNLGSTNLWGTVNTITPDKIADHLRVNLGEYWTQEKRAYKIKQINDIPIAQETNALKGKKIAAFGDSITEPKNDPNSSYMDGFSDNNEMIVRNYALGFGRLLNNALTTDQADWTSATNDDQNTVANQILRFLADGFVPDVVVLTGGTNDVNGTVSEGVLTTAITNYVTPASQDKTTVYGLFFYAVRKLREVNPSVKIIFIIPPKRVLDDATNANMLSKFYNQYITATQALGVEYIDWFYYFDALTPVVDNPMYQDGTHPSEEAKIVQYKEVLNLVKKYYK